jgi:hypothetical protein
VFPLILGAVAGWSVLEQSENTLVRAVVLVVAVVEGVIPALFASLRIDGRVDECTRLEAEYTNLGDRFRQAALNASHKSSSECEMEFQPLMERLEMARRESTVPDWCVRRAEAKIKHGHHNAAVSEAA